MYAYTTTNLKATNNKGWENEIPAGTRVKITYTNEARATFRAPGKYYGSTSLDNLTPEN